MKISEIKNYQKQVQKFNTFTGIYRPLRCLDVLTLDQLFKLIKGPSINNCIR